MNGFWPDALIVRKDQTVAHAAELQYWYRYTLSRLTVFSNLLCSSYGVFEPVAKMVLLCCAT